MSHCGSVLTCEKAVKTLYKGKKVLRISKSIKQQTKNNHTKNDDPQIPQPDLRFASGNSEANSQRQTKTQKRGQSPNKNTHRIDLQSDAVAKALHHTQKHAKDELCIAAAQADMKTPARNLTQA